MMIPVLNSLAWSLWELRERRLCDEFGTEIHPYEYPSNGIDGKPGLHFTAQPSPARSARDPRTNESPTMLKLPPSLC